MNLSDLVSKEDCLVTRVWGFSPETWGAVGFPTQGISSKWLERGKAMRVVCFVSHRGAEHFLDPDQGRVLGIYELLPEGVNLVEDGVLDPLHLDERQNFRKDGGFRWPHGLKANRAWRFRPSPRTRESMPNARAQGHDVSVDLRTISDRDYDLLSQDNYRLVEVPVFGVENDLTRVAQPTAQPSHIYLLACGNRDVLQLIPDWRHGEVLIKIGCASDVSVRLAGLNDDPFAKIFGLKLAKTASRHVGVNAARSEESKYLAEAALSGRPACDLSTEFFFVSQGVHDDLQRRIGTTIRVA